MNPYTAEYYERGKECGISNYENYSWKPELTVPACKKIAEYLGMNRGDSIVDCGCAKGFYVKAMRMLGYRAFGFDISDYAIAMADPEIKEYVTRLLPKRAFDWATLKDLCEHIPAQELFSLIGVLNDRVTKGMLIIVPLSSERDGKYIRSEDEADKTHVIRWPMNDWISFLEEAAPDFNVNASYNIHGIKPAASEVRHSCGFFTLIRP